MLSMPQLRGPENHVTDDSSSNLSLGIDQTHITSCAFRSVKEAVSKFGSNRDWKAHKVQTLRDGSLWTKNLIKYTSCLNTRTVRGSKEAKIKVLKELENTKISDEEMAQGIANEASVAAKAQLEEYGSLMIERDISVKKLKKLFRHRKSREDAERRITVAVPETSIHSNGRRIKTGEEELQRINHQTTDGDSNDDPENQSEDLTLLCKQQLLQQRRNLKMKHDIEKAYAEVDSLKATVRKAYAEGIH
ncbi:hypothetical protein F3Y22_tig00110210pilonHSYRG00087 [Hibiscus syriacus]|uniref:Uncharacterized protein n=1 Tax=Hibiscus syriacus TaxID=106335 RepID=A0A6A3BCH4_HIBSY|nr:hypothetical protein F3Y22_tig00110210pilonHSYRG00087 [Hibiscus syriacus]